MPSDSNNTNLIDLISILLRFGVPERPLINPQKLSKYLSNLVDASTWSSPIGLSVATSTAIHICALATLTAVVSSPERTPSDEDGRRDQDFSMQLTQTQTKTQTTSSTQAESGPTDETPKEHSEAGSNSPAISAPPEPETPANNRSNETTTSAEPNGAGELDELEAKPFLSNKNRVNIRKTPSGKRPVLDENGSAKTKKASGEVPTDRECSSKPPRVVKRVRAEGSSYPIQARRRKLSGTVVGRLRITENGRVANVELLETAGHGFDKLARQVFKKWKFEPAKANCRSVPSRVRVTHTFSLQRD